MAATYQEFGKVFGLEYGRKSQVSKHLWSQHQNILQNHFWKAKEIKFSVHTSGFDKLVQQLC